MKINSSYSHVATLVKKKCTKNLNEFSFYILGKYKLPVPRLFHSLSAYKLIPGLEISLTLLMSIVATACLKLTWPFMYGSSSCALLRMTRGTGWYIRECHTSQSGRATLCPQCVIEACQLELLTSSTTLKVGSLLEEVYVCKSVSWI